MRYDELNSDLQLAWEQPQPMTGLRDGYGYLPYPSGGNCAIWADVARELSWDESFVFGASDIELAGAPSWPGFRVAFVPAAVIQRRFRDRPLAIARQHFRYGMASPTCSGASANMACPTATAAKRLSTGSGCYATRSGCCAAQMDGATGCGWPPQDRDESMAVFAGESCIL